eukprot:3021559-Amphidinium_carterae.1
MPEPAPESGSVAKELDELPLSPTGAEQEEETCGARRSCRQTLSRKEKFWFTAHCGWVLDASAEEILDNNVLKDNIMT